MEILSLSYSLPNESLLQNCFDSNAENCYVVFTRIYFKVKLSMRRILSFYVIFLAFAFFQNANAINQLSLSMGAAFPMSGNHSTVSDTQGYPADLYLSQSSNASTVYDLELDHVLAIHSHIRYSAGVDLNVDTNQVLNGALWRQGSELYNNYTYQMKFSRFTLLSDLKMALITNQSWQPYVVLGLGLSFNHADYSEQANAGIHPREEAIFSNTQDQLAYMLGLGASYTISKHWSARASYRYLNAGDVTLRTESGAKGPKQQLAGQLIMFGVTYTF